MSAQQQAIELAESRQDYYVRWGYADTGVKTEGPFSEAEKDELVSRLFVQPGIILQVFKLVEEYGGH